MGAPLFGRVALQRQVDTLLGTIPDGKKGCIVAVDAGHGWVELVTMVKVDDHWQLEGRLRHERSAGLSGHVELRMVW